MENWKCVSGATDTYCLKVETGWLYRYQHNTMDNMCFVPEAPCGPLDHRDVALRWVLKRMVRQAHDLKNSDRIVESNADRRVGIEVQYWAKEILAVMGND